MKGTRWSSVTAATLLCICTATAFLLFRKVLVFPVIIVMWLVALW